MSWLTIYEPEPGGKQHVTKEGQWPITVQLKASISEGRLGGPAGLSLSRTPGSGQPEAAMALLCLVFYSFIGEEWSLLSPLY